MQFAVSNFSSYWSDKRNNLHYYILNISESYFPFFSSDFLQYFFLFLSVCPLLYRLWAYFDLYIAHVLYVWEVMTHSNVIYKMGQNLLDIL